MTAERRFTADELALVVETIEWRISILDADGQVQPRLWDVLRAGRAAHESQVVYERDVDSRSAASPYGPVRSFRLYRG